MRPIVLAATARPPAPGSVAAAYAHFLTDMEIGRSPASVRTYRAGLGRFAEFLSTLELGGAPDAPPGADADELPALRAPVAALTTEHPIEFLRWLARGNAATPKATLMTYTTAVSRFYAFLVREDIRPDLALARMQLRLTALRGKRPRPLPRVPGDEVVAAIVRAARARPANGDATHERIRLRDIALVEALRGSGMRVGEAVGLRRGDLDREGRSARVLGKGSKERIVYFTDEAWRAIETYLGMRADGASGRGLGSLPVFARHDRAAAGRPRPLSTKAVREVVEALARRAAVEDAGVTPHRFRAWFATHLVAETGDLAAVQDLLGHESANTTRVYTRVAGARLRDVHRRAFGSAERGML